MREITQDRPIIKKLCTMQATCQSVVGPYTCSYKDQLRGDSVSKLKRWKNYFGCNESTDEYKKEGDKGHIYVEYCSCGGLN